MTERIDWYSDAIYYRVDVRAFSDSNADGQGDLPGLTSKLDYLVSLGIDCIWLMPINPIDGIYGGPIDYYSVQREVGTLTEFDAFIEAAHERGLRVIQDLAINHTSNQHPWFTAGRSDPQSRFGKYFVWSHDDQLYKGAKVISPLNGQSNWHLDSGAKQYYWSRLSPALPELNFDNSELRTEIVKVMQFWYSKGVDGLAIGHIPFLFERETTDCENLPETHQYIKAVRSFISQSFPGRILMGVINQQPLGIQKYFAEGNELHLNLNTPLTARIFTALAEQDGFILKRFLDTLPVPPKDCQWVNPLLGSEGLPVDLISPDHYDLLNQFYGQVTQTPDGPRIYRRLTSLFKNDQRRLRLLQALVFSIPGTPGIFYGDEIGLGERPDLGGRKGLLTPMQWIESKTAGFSAADPVHFYTPLVDNPDLDWRTINVIEQESNPASLLYFMRDLIRTRRDHPELVWGKLDWVETDNTAVVAFIRQLDERRLFAIYNLSDRTSGARIPREIRQAHRLDLLGGYLRLQPDLTNLTLKPYQFAWFEL